jgi:hypothetical protein
VSVDIQTAFAADTHRAEGATEHGKVMYVSSRMMMMVMMIQFNSYLFMCQLNSQRANYKVSTSE